MKSQQISPWSFYNDYATTITLTIDENSSNNEKLKHLPKRKKRQTKNKIQSTKSIIQEDVIVQKVEPQAPVNHPQRFITKEVSFDSTEQSLLRKYQDTYHDSLRLQSQKEELEKSYENQVILRLIWNELKKERDHQAFLELQQEQYKQRHKESTKQSQGLKLPKIQRNRFTQIVNCKFADQKEKKCAQYSNQLLQQLLKYKVKSMTNHKMKALGVSKQILPRTSNHHSALFHQ